MVADWPRNHNMHPPPTLQTGFHWSPANLCVLQAHCWNLSVFWQGTPGWTPVFASYSSCSLNINQLLTRRTSNLRWIDCRLQLSNKSLQIVKFCWLLALTVAMLVGWGRLSCSSMLATLCCFVAKLPIDMTATAKWWCTTQLHWCKTRLCALNSYRHSYWLFWPTLFSMGCSSKCRS